MLRLPRLQRTVALVDPKGQPGLEFHRWFDKYGSSIEDAFNQLAEQVAAIAAANAAAAAAASAAADAQAAADAAQSATDGNTLQLDDLDLTTAKLALLGF